MVIGAAGGESRLQPRDAGVPCDQVLGASGKQLRMLLLLQVPALPPALRVRPLPGRLGPRLAPPAPHSTGRGLLGFLSQEWFRIYFEIIRLLEVPTLIKTSFFWVCTKNIFR